jgi:hypothetical protein
MVLVIKAAADLRDAHMTVIRVDLPDIRQGLPEESIEGGSGGLRKMSEKKIGLRTEEHLQTKASNDS